MTDAVHHPKHYTSHPSGIETIEITRHLPFDHGCVFKYVMRREGKEHVRSLKSALWYLEDLYRQPALKADYRVVKNLADLFDQIIQAETNQNAKKFYRAFHSLLLNQCESAYKRTKEALENLLSEAVQSIAEPQQSQWRAAA
jgi:hypothetical protein